MTNAIPTHSVREIVARKAVLMDDLIRLLRRRGPTALEDLRDRLCVASRKQFHAAVNELVRTGQAQRTSQGLAATAQKGAA